MRGRAGRSGEARREPSSRTDPAGARRIRESGVPFLPSYAVINNLVRNWRTPVGIAVNLVSRLGPRDIKGIAVDRSVPEALREQAHEAAETDWREYGGKARAEGVTVQRQVDGLVANTMRSVQAL